MCSCTTFTTPSAAYNCFQLKPNSERCGGGKILFYFRRRLGNLWVNNPIQLQSLFSPGALFLLGAALPCTLIKVEIRRGGMGTQQKTQAENWRSKGQTEAEGREREAQRVTAERAEPGRDGGETTAIRGGREQWAERSPGLAFISV